MLCPQCNTELSDSTSVCPQCGSPVFAAAPMRPQASSFSYLPAGAPQWPTTASAQTPYVLAGQTQRAPAGTPLATPDIDEPERIRRKPGSLSLPLVLLLLFGSILVGGGLSYGALALQNRNNGPQPNRVISLTPPASPTAAPSSTPGTTLSPTPSTAGNQLPTPISFQNGVSTDLGITMKFPSGWIQEKTQQGSNGNKDIAFHPSTQLPVSMIVLQISAANSAQITNASDINTANIQEFGTANSLSSPQISTNTPTSRTIGGVTWAEEDAVFTTSSGTAYHVVSLTAKHKVYYYNILYFAPSTAYDEAMAKYYSKMLDSFQFTS